MRFATIVGALSLFFAACSDAEFASPTGSSVAKAGKSVGIGKGHDDDAKPSTPADAAPADPSLTPPDTADGTTTGNDGGAEGDVDGGDGASNTGTTDAGGDSATTGGDTSLLTDDDLLKLCEGATTQTFDVEFDTSKVSCPFGTGDNGAKDNGQLVARVEETKAVTVPDGKRICGISLSSSAKGFRYDDELLLTVNDGVLFATSSAMTANLTKTDDVPVYDWAKVKGVSAKKTFPAACTLSSTCTVPESQETGSIAYAVSSEGSLKIARFLKQPKMLTFKLVTTGDDDTSTDCKHAKLPLSVTLKVSK